jgi:thiamine pyrophosphokinase
MRAVIFGNGTLWQPEYERSLIRDTDLIICANGGSRHAHALGIVPHRLIGDTDSLPEHVNAWLQSHHVHADTYSHEKDETDFELALSAVIEAGLSQVLMLGATGTRVDHSFANLSLLATAKRAGLAAEMVVGYQHCSLIWDETITVEGQPGETISLLPWGGDAEGVSINNAYWPLDNATLRFGTARGISNRLTQHSTLITVRQGCLLVVQHRGPVD